MGTCAIVAMAAFLLGSAWQQNRTPRAAPDTTTLKTPATQPAKPAPAIDTQTPPSAPSITGSDSPIVSQSVKADYQPRSALLIGANEMVLYHQKAFQEIVRAVYDRVPVITLVNNDEEADLARDLIADAGLPDNSIHILQHPLNSMWLRDFGPIFSRWSDGRLAVVDARYNAESDQNRNRDDDFNASIAQMLGLPLIHMPLIVEGGNIMFNGDGLLVTTTRVMTREENRHLTPRSIGEIFAKNLGCRSWTFVRELEGEPTGHVDMFLTFLRRNHVVIGRYDPAYDEVNAGILDDAARLLAAEQTSMGPMIVTRMPMPPRSPEGHWRTYCNILLVNGVLLMPSFSDVDPALEQEAEDIYSRVLPNWKVVRIPSDSLISKRGLLHCVAIGIPGNVNVRPLLDATRHQSAEF